MFHVFRSYLLDTHLKFCFREATKVSISLRRKQKEVALSHLRTQKLLEDIVKKRSSSLETLQATMIRVETAAGDVEVRGPGLSIYVILTTYYLFCRS